MDKKKALAVNGLLWTAFGIFAAVYVSLSFIPLLGDRQDTVLSIAYLFPVVLAAGAGLVAARRAAPEEKRFWISLLAGVSFLALTEFYWAYIQISQGASPTAPSFADATTLLAYIPFFLMTLSMSRLSRSLPVTKARYIVDTLVSVLFMAVVVWWLVGRGVVLHPNAVDSSQVWNAVYPVLDIGLFFGISAGIFGLKLSQWRPWEAMIAVGILCLAVADIGYAYFAGRGLYNLNGGYAGVIDLLWMGMYFLFFMAAVVRLEQAQAKERPKTLARLETAKSRFQEVVVFGLIAGFMPFFIFMSNTDTRIDKWALLVFGASLGALILLRAVLVVQENNRLLAHSVTDPVTGLYNYRYFQRKMVEETDRANRYKEPLSLAIIDLDDFAKVNTIFGHTEGDRVLRDVGICLRQSVRLSDTVCRIGGDEFSLVMPMASPMEALKLCLRAHRALQEMFTRSRVGSGCSIGIASNPEHGREKEALEISADAALYWAKFHGKNQAVLYDAQAMDIMNPQERVKKAEELAYMNTVHALAAAVDARDSYTQFHSKNVAVLVALFGEELGLDEAKTKMMTTAALLHDVGKIGVSDNILRKPGALTADEREDIKAHPTLSGKILSATTLTEVLPWIEAHHEWWNGAGYPAGLAADDIPYEARILALCDAYDAMTSDRPYRKALTKDAALRELREGRGTQFDPDLTDRFIALLRTVPDIRLAADGS